MTLTLEVIIEQDQLQIWWRTNLKFMTGRPCDGVI